MYIHEGRKIGCTGTDWCATYEPCGTLGQLETNHVGQLAMQARTHAQEGLHAVTMINGLPSCTGSLALALVED